MTDFSEMFAVPERDFTRGRYGRPMILGLDGAEVEYLRPSTVAKYASGGSEGLRRWEVARTARSVAARPLLARRIRDAMADSHVVRMVEQASDNAASEAGTAFHDAVHHGTLDVDLQDAVGIRAAVLARVGLTEVPELRERLVVSDTYGLAGRWDGVVRCPDGYEVEFSSIPSRQEPGRTYAATVDLSNRLVVLDDKTGNNAVRWTQSGQPRGAEAATMQLTAYANSSLYDVDTGVRTRVDGLTPVVGLIVHTDLVAHWTRLVWTLLDDRALTACVNLARWKTSLTAVGDE